MSMHVVIGAGVIPFAIALFLVINADQTYERWRVLAASLTTALAVIALDRWLPIEPGIGGLFSSLDPLWMPAVIAAIFATLVGRSRRNAFAGAVFGVLLTDLYAFFVQLSIGITTPQLHIGSAGTLDAVTLSGILAVVLVEGVGETRERLYRYQQRRAIRRRTVVLSGVTLSVLLVSLFSIYGLYAQWSGLMDGSTGHRPHSDLDYIYSMLTADDQFIAAFSHPLYRGDQYGTADDAWYQVVNVRGRIARVERVSADLASMDRAELVRSPTGLFTAVPVATAPRRRQQPTGLIQWLNGSHQVAPIRPQANRDRKPAPDAPLIVILHTHNAESYVSSDGDAFMQGIGGIHEVGQALAEQLTGVGYRVVHDESVHLPHDRGAYRRSRRTIYRHLSEQPLLIIDVHRDALPNEEYAHIIDGEGVTQLRLVVGRQNPNIEQNLAFAKQLKAVGDDLYPGLVKGIYLGQGNYNQDLGPRTILFEMGSHTNARESAERSAIYVAEIIKTWHRRRLR